MIEIWTDGACYPNPGNGAWAWVRGRAGNTVHGAGYEIETTNNRMELLAVVRAIESNEGELTIHSDSQYVVQGAMSWRHAWKRKKWKGVKNPDLWRRLSDLLEMRSIRLNWVRGHAGNEMNELADLLAAQTFEKRFGINLRRKTWKR